MKVTDIFDWIVGTSTGGILALGLVYGNKQTFADYELHLNSIILEAKKNLSELRQLYFKIRDQVFSAGRLGMGYNTEVFERVLKEEFGTEALMSDISHPRYVNCHFPPLVSHIILFVLSGYSLLQSTRRPISQSFTSSTTVSITSSATVRITPHT